MRNQKKPSVHFSHRACAILYSIKFDTFASLLLEPIADPMHRLNPFSKLPQLAPQTTHMRIHRAFNAVILLPPNRIHQNTAREDTPRGMSK